MNKVKKLLGEWLIERGMISADHLQIALTEQRAQTGLIGQILVRMGFISEAMLRDALAAQFGQETIDLAQTVIDPAAIVLLAKDFCLRYQVLPIAYYKDSKKLILATTAANSLLAIDQVRMQLGFGVVIQALLATEQDLLRAIEQYYDVELSIDGILQEIETGEIDLMSAQSSNLEYRQPVVRLIDALLADAVRAEASDIHFEPEATFVRIRYRIDGVLRQIRSLHKNYWMAMVVRLKVISGMNIAETRMPQDGRLSLAFAGRALDFRVAAHPTAHGENIVLRILDRQKGLLALDAIGLSVESLRTLHLMLARPEGIVLLTGPTGSGKTTTLYSILNHISSEAINIMTLEDPVEYPMPLVRQTSLTDAVKMDFASGIRSMMRQDPDVILVGEIRDHETAEMAFRAAMTGHQVYTTLHSNSALGALPRLQDFGILPDVLAGNIIGIIGQRLVRKLCVACKQAYIASPEELPLLGLPLDSAPTSLYRATGCLKCHMQGYRGRVAVMEVLKINAELDDLIASHASAREVREAALAQGFQRLADDAVRLVLRGATALDEVARVVDLTHRVQ